MHTIIKFDIFYPPEYLKKKQSENIQAISKMNFDEYFHWLMNLKMGYYDLFQKYFKSKGWDAFDIYYQDDVLIEKLAEKYELKCSIKDFVTRRGFNYWRDISIDLLKRAIQRKKIRKELKKQIILRKFIEKINPDIIFLREPCQIDNLFWKPYKNKIFIATMIGCNIGHPINWMLHTSDMVFTNAREFTDFFNLNLVESYLIDYGFDTELPKELSFKEKKYDVSFVGLLGTKDQEKKTIMMEAIAEKFNFFWWGPKGELLNHYPNLLKRWQGIVAGREMYQVYADSKIVVNEYVHSNANKAINLRLKEAMGVGTCQITRFAENIKHIADSNAVVFFNDKDDCIDKISYYLKHDKEREQIGLNARNYINENYSNMKLLDFIREKVSTGIKLK